MATGSLNPLGFIHIDSDSASSLHPSGTVLTVDAAGGPVTGTGALTSQAASVSGVGSRETKGSGVLTSAVATLNGAGKREVKGTGSLESAVSTIAGTGTVSGAITGIGALTAQLSSVSGTGTREVKGTGALESQVATISGTGIGGSALPVTGGAGGGRKKRQRQFANINGTLVEVGSYKEATKLFQHLHKTKAKPKRRRIKLRVAGKVTIFDSPSQPLALREIHKVLDTRIDEEEEMMLMLLMAA